MKNTIPTFLRAFAAAACLWAKRPKLAGWGSIGAVLLGIFLLSVPAVATTIVYKYSVVIFGTCLMYWLNRHLADDARPSSFLDDAGNVVDGQETAYAASLQHRGMVIAGGVIALALLV